IATLVASGALAQSMTPTDPAATPGAEQTEMTIHAEGHLASDVIGESVYNGTGEEAENIGKVTDLVISPDGNVEAIVVGVGGFLGIGQKEVALEYDLIEWSEQPDGERWLVVPTTKEALEAQAEFDRAAYRPMPADAEVGQTTPATKSDLDAAPAEGTDTSTSTAPAGDAATSDAPDTAPSTDTGTAVTPAPVAPTTPPADAPADAPAATTNDTTSAPATDSAADTTDTGAAVDRNTLTEVPADQISADNLIGTTVYGADDENIGEINDVVLSDDGQIDAVIIDVGGFLGIGEKPVAVGMD